MRRKNSGAPGKLTKHIRTRFLSGLLVSVPLFATWFVLRFVFRLMTGMLEPVVRPWVSHWPRFIGPLISLLATTVLIYLAGLITTFVVGRRLIRFAETLLLKLPMVGHVYSAAKQVVNTFSQTSRAGFKAAVLVSFPYHGAVSLGFVTGTTLAPDGKLLYRVFMPTAPNPTSGFVLLVPQEEIQFTNITVEDGLKMMVSGGLLAPSQYQLKEHSAIVSSSPSTPPTAAGSVP
ncbi:MAG: DUF502 domain-containing protein [Kiritimatiellia bacterium]